MNRLDQNIPEKANRVLNVILITLILILLRIWHLSVIEYEDKLQQAQKPRHRLVVKPARRATIRDRFNLPLAINKIAYSVSIQYSQLVQIPYVRWENGENGKKNKVFKRKAYIDSLSDVLAKELSLDKERLKDLIYAKGPLYGQIPFVIKENLSEKEYYRLKMLEKDWLGIHTEIKSKRVYPENKVASDVIGYLGAINKQEYESFIHRMKTLEQYMEESKNDPEIPLPEGIESKEMARAQLEKLKRHAYKVSDYIGKTGIEGRFEQVLRGFQGKKTFYSDARGNFLRELPGSQDPIPGKRILLTISLELQKYAEQLLAENESIREAFVSKPNAPSSDKQPWIKGGAIIAIDPHSGEVLALASHPRIDPNDFIFSGSDEEIKNKQLNIGKWFESESSIGKIWDQITPLTKELFDVSKGGFYEKTLNLSWDNYLSFILPKQSPVVQALEKIKTVKKAVEVQNAFQKLLKIGEEENPYVICEALFPKDDALIATSSKVASDLKEAFNRQKQEVAKFKSILAPYLAGIESDYEKILTVDLCRVAVNENLFSDSLLEKAGSQTLSFFHDASGAFANLKPVIFEQTKKLYRKHHYQKWRKENETAFLKEKRAEETLLKKYPKPYIDYLDKQEKALFEAFWNRYGLKIIASICGGYTPPPHDDEISPYIEYFSTAKAVQGLEQCSSRNHQRNILQKALSNLNYDEAISYLAALRTFKELERPLLGRYRSLLHENGIKKEKHLAAAFYPSKSFGYGRSQAYRQATTQGSIFKLVTAYEALIERYKILGKANVSSAELNPLEMTDVFQKNGNKAIVGYFKDGSPIFQSYKGGRIPKSTSKSIGKIDLVKALETSSNPYFSLLAKDVIESPENLLQAARNFGYGEKTGIDLPGEIPGSLPKDLDWNQTGLYAFAIGQHSLVVTPLQTSIMLASLVNGGKVLKPQVVRLLAGKDPWSLESAQDFDNILSRPQFPYQDFLKLAGVNFPLFSASLDDNQKSLITKIPPEIKKTIPVPAPVRDMLLEGMKRVVSKMQQSGLGSLSRTYKDHPEAISDFVDLKDAFIGKTSTSESMENIDLDPLTGTNLYTHVWFGGISFESDGENKQELFLRDPWGKPELVVVVYLRFGKFGKEAAPIAAQIVKKWREIKASHQ